MNNNNVSEHENTVFNVFLVLFEYYLFEFSIIYLNIVIKTIINVNYSKNKLIYQLQILVVGNYFRSEKIDPHGELFCSKNKIYNLYFPFSSPWGAIRHYTVHEL